MVNLFLGFVRLIRKSIKFELENEYKQKLSFYQNKIQKIQLKNFKENQQKLLT